MSWNDSELLQLPHFTAREAKHATKGRKGASGIADFLEVPDDEKKVRVLCLCGRVCVCMSECEDVCVC